MRLLAHLSDLHFGCHDAVIVERLLDDLAAHRPDLVVISGDLTQRARHREFAAARAFLAQLSAPVIAVPGNHDVPLYNLARRALAPLRRFAHYISAVEHPFFADDEIAVLGINTARSMTISQGRISHDQMAAIRAAFAAAPKTALRMLVTHHPLLAPPHAPERRVVGRAAPALRAVAEAGVALLLTGHDHRAFAGEVASQPLSTQSAVLVSQAGTATSTRRRGELNSYNLLRIAGHEVECLERSWDGDRFATTATQRFAHRERRWACSS